jgi:hypothetical protein
VSNLKLGRAALILAALVVATACGRRSSVTKGDLSAVASSKELVVPAPVDTQPSSVNSLIVATQDCDMSGLCFAYMSAAAFQDAGLSASPRFEDFADLRLCASMSTLSGKTHLALRGALYRNNDQLIPDLYFAKVVNSHGPPRAEDVADLVAQVLRSQHVQRFIARGPGSATSARLQPLSPEAVRDACAH